MEGQKPMGPQQPQSQAEKPQGDPEAIAQGIMQAVSQLKEMIPAEIFTKFISQLSNGGQEKPEAPGPVGPVPVEGGVQGQPRF